MWWVLYGISYGKVLCGECYTAYRTVRYCVMGVIRHIVRKGTVWWVLYGISYGKVLGGECYTAYRTVRYCLVRCMSYRTVRYCVVGVIRHIVR